MNFGADSDSDDSKKDKGSDADKEEKKSNTGTNPMALLGGPSIVDIGGPGSNMIGGGLGSQRNREPTLFGGNAAKKEPT